MLVPNEHAARSATTGTLRCCATAVAISDTSSEPAVVQLALDDVDDSHRLVDLLVDGSTIAIEKNGTCWVTLEGYGYRWLRVLAPDHKRLN